MPVGNIPVKIILFYRNSKEGVRTTECPHPQFYESVNERFSVFLYTILFYLNFYFGFISRLILGNDGIFSLFL